MRNHLSGMLRSSTCWVLTVMVLPCGAGLAQDGGLDRLMNQTQTPAASPTTEPATQFIGRQQSPWAATAPLPAPVQIRQDVCPPGSYYPSTPAANSPWNPYSTEQEYIFDGNDRSLRVRVDQDWNVYGLDTEDTIGHYDTIDGRRLVTPSNRVAIYAPRFGSVRKVDGLLSARLNQPVNAFEEKLETVASSVADLSTTTKQNLSLNRFKSNRRASGLMDQTRGVAADNTTHLIGYRNVMEAYANSGLIRNGKFHGSDGPMLQYGMQSALSWETDLGLQVMAKGIQPIIVRDVTTAQELMAVDADDEAILRVVKLASRLAARTGDVVDFTIRFDNLSKDPIGNVTIMDNLTRRLEYIPGTAECSLEATFIDEINESESLKLRWEVLEPLAPGTGGVIKFQCRVR